MEIDQIAAVLGWCLVINSSFLVLWFVGYASARKTMMQLHRKWFKVSSERMNAVHYQGMALVKVLVIIFNLAPYLAIRIIQQ